MRTSRGFAFIPVLLIILIGVAAGIFLAQKKFVTLRNLPMYSGLDNPNEPIIQESTLRSAYESLNLRRILNSTSSGRIPPAAPPSTRSATKY